MSAQSSEIRIVIFGHYHVCSLEQYLHDQICQNVGEKDWLNLDINRKEITISFLGIDGLCLDTAHAYQEDLAAYSPHAVIMHLGENDVHKDTFGGAQDLAEKIISFAEQLIESSTVQKVAICQLLPRLKPHCADYYNKLDDVNKALQQLMMNYPAMLYFRHRGLWTGREKVLDPDGVGFNLVGKHRFFRSIRGAVLYVKKLLEGKEQTKQEIRTERKQ